MNDLKLVFNRQKEFFNLRKTNDINFRCIKKRLREI